MTINKKQKITIIAGAAIIITVFIIWAAGGFHIFTHQKELITLPQTDVDKLLGQPPAHAWKDHFVLGLEYTLLTTAIVVLISGLFIYLFKTKKKAE